MQIIYRLPNCKTYHSSNEISLLLWAESVLMNKEIKKIRRRKPLLWAVAMKVVLSIILFSILIIRFIKDKHIESWTNILILFFIISTISDIAKFLRKEDEPPIALRINNEGITNYFQFKELGTIPWEDIEFAGVKNNLWGRYVIVKVKNPLEYINKISANFKLKKLLRENNAKHQTPIVINTNELNITPNELRDWIKLGIKNKLNQ